MAGNPSRTVIPAYEKNPQSFVRRPPRTFCIISLVQMWSVGSVWPLERVSHSCEPMVLLYEPGAVPILVSLYHGMELVSGTPPPLTSYPCLSGIRYLLVSGWIPLFYFSLPRERTRPWEKMSVGFRDFVESPQDKLSTDPFDKFPAFSTFSP